MSSIGIDLGTTFSCVATFRKNRPEVLANNIEKHTTPSVVAFHNNKRLVGEEAVVKLTMPDSQVVYDTKRLIGRNFDDEIVQNDIKDWPFRVTKRSDGLCDVVVKENDIEKALHPEQISATILGKLAKFAEAKTLQKPEYVVITVPAYFNDSQRQSTKLAGKIAGLNVVGIINEPTAAAIAYGYRNTIAGKKILVYDFGGGTLDVTILQITDKKGNAGFDVLSTSGNTHLGGEDFDQILLEYCLRKLKSKGHNYASDPYKKQIIRMACQTAKKSLSSQSDVNISFMIDGKGESIPITRKRFETICDDIFCEIEEPIAEALQKANLDEDGIDEVIMVGGSSRIPKVHEKIQEFFEGKRVYYPLNPDEAIAEGAAIYAAKIAQELEDDDDDDFNGLVKIEINDIIPFPIGTTLTGDRFDVVIEEKTNYPVTVKKTYYTVKENQSTMLNEIRQGYSEKSSENHLIDKFTITGIPPGPKQSVTDEYVVDRLGILTVTSTIDANGVKKSLTIKKEKYNFTQQQIEAMQKDHDEYINREQKITDKARKLDNLEKEVYAKLIETTKGTPERKKMDQYLIEIKEWISVNRNASDSEIQRKMDEIKKYRV